MRHETGGSGKGTFDKKQVNRVDFSLARYGV